MDLGILGWLAALNVRSGRIGWRLRDALGAALDIDVEIGAGVVGLSLNAPGRGELRLSGGDAVWTPAAGTALRTSFGDPSLLAPLRQGVALNPTPALGQLQTLSGGVGAALRWLNDFEPHVTVLVIPGVSALGLDLPPLALGGISLPRMRADVSLRNVAIDLGVGAVAFELRLHDATAVSGGTMSIDADDHHVELVEPALRLAADVAYSLHDGIGAATLDWLWAAGSSFAAELPGPVPQAASITGEQVSCVARGIVYELSRNGPKVRGGEVKLSCAEADAALTGFTIGPLTAERIDLEVKDLGLVLSTEDAGSRAVLTLGEARARATNPKALELPTLGAADFDPAVGVTAEVRGLTLAVPQAPGTFQSGVVDVDATMLPLKLDLSGLQVAVTSKTQVRAELAINGVDRRIGAMLKFATAEISFPEAPKPIKLTDASVEHTQLFPSGMLAPPKAVLKSQCIEQISLTVDLPTWPVMGARDVSISANGHRALIELIDIVAAQAGAPGWLREIIDWLGRMTDAGELLGQLSDIAGIFSVRIEDIRVLLGLGAIAIQVDGPLSGDRTIAFRVKSSLTGVGVGVVYSWPSPKWDDWGHRDEDQHNEWWRFHVDLPDLIVKVQFTYDATAKKIRFTGVGMFFDVTGGGGGPIVDIQDKVTALISAYFGVSTVVQAIVDALNLSVPSGLPDSWDVSELSLLKAGPNVQGFRINLRAYSAEFGQL